MHLSMMSSAPRWLEDCLDIADAARLHALYVVDHPSFPAPDAWSWLAFAAGRTKRIRLGTHVTGAPFHHATRLAFQVATVDVLSSGRATLGIGTAYEHGDFRPYSFPMGRFPERVRQLEETIRVITALWTQEKTEHSGEFYSLEGGAPFAPKPVQQPRPPVIVGLNTAGLALGAASRVADGINTWQLGPAEVGEIAGKAREAWTAAGRDQAGMLLTSDVVFGRGMDTAGANALAERISQMAQSWGRSEKVTRWNAGGVLYGDGDSMVEQAQRFAAIGVGELTVSIGSRDDLEWFNAEVAARM